MTTIFALSTPPGRSAIAVVRLSGPDTRRALEALGVYPLPKPRYATRRRLVSPRSGLPVDDALILLFPAPRSYTGEDMGEIHLHGSPAVVRGLLGDLSSLPGLRPAESGEFTRRAFHNGKLDLLQAEAIADLIEAETPVQQRQALQQASGGLGEFFEGLRHSLIRILALFEAYLDFPEEDIPPSVLDDAHETIDRVISKIRLHVQASTHAPKIREGLRLVLCGAPNTGKSSLLNRLAQQDIALVSPIPGTTRDVVSTYLEIGGYPFTVSDTAGIRLTTDKIERAGIERATARMEEADIILHVMDGTHPVFHPAIPLPNDGVIHVLNKSDLISKRECVFEKGIWVSAHTGEGVENLIRVICDTLPFYCDAPVSTRTRHFHGLTSCVHLLENVKSDIALELKVEYLRSSCAELGKLSGTYDMNAVLSEIFSSFCIGK